MNRRAFLGSVGSAGAAALAGCIQPVSGGTGTLATRVSDQPGDIGDFESCVVTIDEIRVRPASAIATDTGSAAGTGGADAAVRTIDVGGATADLVDLQGEKSELIDETDLEAGDYEWLKLAVSGVDATLAGGGDATVTTPGQAPLKFNASFEIREGTTTSFTADFRPVKQGGSGSYTLQPVAKAVEVTYGDVTETATE